MHRRLRNILVAVAFALQAGTVAPADAQPKAPPGAAATPSPGVTPASVVTPAPIPNPQLTSPPEPPFVAHGDPSDPGCYRETVHDRADLCAQWRAALAAEAAASSSGRANTIAIVSSVFSLLGIIGLLVTLWLTRTANTLSRRAAEAAEKTMRDAREIGEAQARCYLSIEAVMAYIGESDGCPRIMVSIRNSGASPALDTTWTASMGYTSMGSDSDADADADAARRDDPRSADAIRAAIAPGKVFDVPYVKLDFPITPAERSHVIEDRNWIQLSVRLVVTANDVFGRSVATEDFYTGVIHDLGVWFALEATGAKPIRTVSEDKTISA